MSTELQVTIITNNISITVLHDKSAHFSILSKCKGVTNRKDKEAVIDSEYRRLSLLSFIYTSGQFEQVIFLVPQLVFGCIFNTHWILVMNDIA